MVLQSKNTTLPAGPVAQSMPKRLASSLRLFWSGMPISCLRRDFS